MPSELAGGCLCGKILNRFFCGVCGSPMYSQREKTPEMMVLKVGTLDGSDGLN